MEIDPMESVERAKEKAEMAASKRKDRLNSMVALSIALLAVFMGICKVKDDNIIQAMQQAQADKIDNFAWFQARNIREEIAKATSTQMELMAPTVPAVNRAAWNAKIAEYRQLEKDQATKKEKQKADAEAADKAYNELNKHDDQFDISDAMIAIAIAMLALCSLTEKRWLFYVAMFPTTVGVIMGLAGLFGWPLYLTFISKLLS